MKGYGRGEGKERRHGNERNICARSVTLGGMLEWQ